MILSGDHVLGAMISPGTIFGRYQIRSLIGVGGMGEVYLAHDPTLRRQVAIKLLPPQWSADRDRLARFEQEAYAASSLNHPNILTIYEIGYSDRYPYIASEFVEGESLRERLRRTGPLPIAELLEVAIQLASAVSAAHKAGIVHRDIKPENIILRSDGYVKLIDFGLAKLIGPPSSLLDLTAGPKRTESTTVAGVVLGTVHYMSPEQVRGLPVDARTDLWSLGVVLYEMATGQCPFEGSTSSDVLATILVREPPEPDFYRPELPAGLSGAIIRALRKDKEERYPSADAFLSDLRKQRQEAERQTELTPLPGAAPRPQEPSSSGQAPPVFPSKKPFVRARILAIGVAVVCLLAASAYFYFRLAGRRNETLNSIAVLPFVNVTGDPNLEFVSEGLSEAIIDELSQVPKLRVVARASSFRLNAKDVDPSDAGQALHARTLVMGTIARQRDTLDLHAELVDAQSKSELWGEHYTRKMEDI
jgi:serine/threonine protein kinase